MKRFIAIALIGMFSFLMVGMLHASSSKDVSVVVKKELGHAFGADLIMDGHTPDVSPAYGKMVTVLSESDLVSGFSSDIVASANGPPTIRYL